LSNHPRFDRRKHRPPPDSGGRLFDPPISPDPTNPAIAIDHLVDNNKLLRTAFDTQVGDLKLWELVAATRREVLTVATEYTSSYRDVSRPTNTAEWIAAPIIMGGHQPDLFHPGVWLKNFAIDAYARRLGGTAINLIVDTDYCRSTSVGVPVGTPDSARLEHVPFDRAGPPVAWEERGAEDLDCFRTFGRRASDLLTPLVPDAILRRWWPLAVERMSLQEVESSTVRTIRPLVVIEGGITSEDELVLCLISLKKQLIQQKAHGLKYRGGSGQRMTCSDDVSSRIPIRQVSSYCLTWKPCE